jgi:hypothetical protein
MRKVITYSTGATEKNQPFNAWNFYFSSETPAFIEELNVNLGKLVAISNSIGPQFQSFERAMKF